MQNLGYRTGGGGGGGGGGECLTFRPTHVMSQFGLSYLIVLLIHLVHERFSCGGPLTHLPSPLATTSNPSMNMTVLNAPCASHYITPNSPLTPNVTEEQEVASNKQVNGVSPPPYAATHNPFNASRHHFSIRQHALSALRQLAAGRLMAKNKRRAIR